MRQWRAALILLFCPACATGAGAQGATKSNGQNLTRVRFVDCAGDSSQECLAWRDRGEQFQRIRDGEAFERLVRVLVTSGGYFPPPGETILINGSTVPYRTAASLADAEQKLLGCGDVRHAVSLQPGQVYRDAAGRLVGVTITTETLEVVCEGTPHIIQSGVEDLVAVPTSNGTTFFSVMRMTR